MRLDGAQVGELKMGDSAAGDIYHGADFDSVMAFLRSYTFDTDQRRETVLKELQARLAAVEEKIAKGETWRRDEQRILTDALDVIRRQARETTDRLDHLVVEADGNKLDRVERQAETDARRAQAEAQAAEIQRKLDRLLAVEAAREEAKARRRRRWRIAWRALIVVALLALAAALAARAF